MRAEGSTVVTRPVFVVCVHQDELPATHYIPNTHHIYEPRVQGNQGTLFQAFEVGEVEASKPTEMENIF